MLCKNCNTQIEDNARFCHACGADATADNQPVVTPVSVPEQPVRSQITVDDLPEHLSPLSPWSYFGLQILYSIPIVGFIFLIIFSFKKSNINRRNFTRSYWCGLIIIGIILAVILIFTLLLGAGAKLTRGY
ncbi:MAG: zinc ribbon domain-containing protein [Clostridia bacterium]|nr:zinc ribbon domain-containing protein [Clostridia bacterium]